MFYRLGIQKTATLLYIDAGVGICSEVDNDDCVVFIDILKDAVILLPICHPDGTIEWPDSTFNCSFEHPFTYYY